MALKGLQGHLSICSYRRTPQESNRLLAMVNFVRSFPHPPHPKCNALLVQLQYPTQNLHSSILVQIHTYGCLSNLNFSSSQNPHIILLAFGTRPAYYSYCAKAAHVQAPHDNGGKNEVGKMGRAYVVLDTETADQYARKTDQPEPENSLVYDMGWVVVKDGNVIAQRSFAISDTFAKHNVMNSSYYAAKLPTYYAGMRMDDNGAWKIATFLEAWQALTKDIKENDVRKVWAYNARFDMLALRNTLETYSNGFVPGYRLLPYGVRFADIWDYASNITSTKKYVRWCLAHGFVTEKGNPSTSAETVYRYLTNNTGFIEQHTALSDADIENAILCAARRRKTKTRHTMGQGWRDAAKTLKTL